METPEVCNGDGDDDQIPLPGFRFHPTDEELVSFYLRRKVEKRPISLELIKQIDIYKHNPWDLPYGSSKVGGEKEWYFYCKRGRKYKNSIRPNRVTGSGFWKATGIDKPVYSNGIGDHEECNNNNNIIIIGLKKTLVYYRGSAGKGSKTDWMMHEFRLPPPNPNHNNLKPLQPNSKNFAQEAEIWTLCRIFKRNVSGRRSYGSSSAAANIWNNNNKHGMQVAAPLTTIKNNIIEEEDQKLRMCNKNNTNFDEFEIMMGASSSEKGNNNNNNNNNNGEISFINFSCESSSMIIQTPEKKPLLLVDHPNYHLNNQEYWRNSNSNNNYEQYSSCCSSIDPSPVSSSGIISPPIIPNYPTINPNQLVDVNDFFTNSNWDELRSMVDML